MTKTNEAGNTSMDNDGHLLRYQPSMTLDELEKEIYGIWACIEQSRGNGSLLKHNHNSGSGQTIQSDYKDENRIVSDFNNVPKLITVAQIGFDEGARRP